MSRSAPSLQRTLATVTVIVASLALIATVSLVLLTSLLDQSTRTLADAVESIRLSSEAEVDVLLHGRTRDVVVRRDLEAQVQRTIEELRPHVSTRTEQRMLSEVRDSVESYLTAMQTAGPDSADVDRAQARAYTAIEELVATNVAQARAAHDHAARWNTAATVLGLTTGSLLIVLTAVLLLWLKRRAFRPVFELAEVMRRFGAGERDARAAVVGPSELREMSARFNEMAAAIAAQRQAQMAFLGGIAHDLRDPLSAVSMSVDVLAVNATPPQVDRSVAVVKRQVTRLERMVGDLLDMARFDAGELDLDVRDEDLRTLVNAVAALRRDSTARHQLTLRLSDEPVGIHCDGQRLEQVISNLVSNAIKYSPGETSVELEVTTESGVAVLRVIDHGLGINDADKQQLFEPFRRVGRSRDAAPGVGLGLWVVRRIIEAHSGTISVDDTPGGGATFTMRLPHHPLRDAAAAANRDGEPLLH
ncbi:MAG: HAMP domain-containing histidine kinase [Myxococcota bacterium]|nr:HAMP domain-containing histidine kinase [Myxococcota bacterium]